MGTMWDMSWDEELFALFDDLESQAAALFGAEREPELVDRARTEYAQVTLASRLMASLDAEVGLELHGVGTLRGPVCRVGSDWLLLRVAGRDWIVRIGAIDLVRDASPLSVPEVAWSPVASLGFTSALRRIAESGERCVFHLLDGGRHEVLVRRVGSDFVEAVLPSGQAALFALDQLAAAQSGGS